MKREFDSGSLWGWGELVPTWRQRHCMEISTSDEKKRLEDSTLPNGMTFTLFPNRVSEALKGLCFVPLSFQAPARV